MAEMDGAREVTGILARWLDVPAPLVTFALVHVILIANVICIMRNTNEQ